MIRHYFEISGRPVPKKTPGERKKEIVFDPKIERFCLQRPHFSRFNTQKKEMAEVQEQLKSQYLHVPLDQPLIVDYIFHIPISKSWKTWQKHQALNGKLMHMQRPDVTNYVKFYEDCMTGIIYIDDCIIQVGTALKKWSQQGKTQIFIREFTETELMEYIRRIQNGETGIVLPQD